MFPETPPAPLDWSFDNCTIERAMGVLGEKWTLVVLREIFTGVRRFEDMRVRTGIPRQVLTNRLSSLVENGVLRREPYREPGARVRQEYRLTPKGFELYPVLMALAEWGNRYLADPEGPPIQYAHRDCGAELHLEIVCADGHAITEKREVQPRPGPGAQLR
ncbi:winged helix-turn-helix transcriptional regulator [Actinoplanes utahensis]|uniref:Transcriptional regulator n=1 Tax=Actinoplanes utahensis TaxID=1869 RepID=A0A0A6X0A5_ACTUT|nr:helix-turn-helix domain-containing protein [Actinoplanes utahensis]KHD73442.1 transcriptional regulator [Actinoplanes utahensis]GIF30226.1 HxlR family transcriptional regulator [Actinoplanes utahensis]